MNKRVLGMAVALMALAMLATPVLAIGPENAIGKNPNLMPPAPYGFDMVPGNGVAHGWITVTPVPKTEITLNAVYGFKIKSAFVVTDPVQVLGMENKWLYLSQSLLYDYWVFMGLDPSFAAFIVANFPDGAYMKWNSVGQ